MPGAYHRLGPARPFRLLLATFYTVSTVLAAFIANQKAPGFLLGLKLDWTKNLARFK